MKHKNMTDHFPIGIMWFDTHSLPSLLFSLSVISKLWWHNIPHSATPSRIRIVISCLRIGSSTWPQFHQNWSSLIWSMDYRSIESHSAFYISTICCRECLSQVSKRLQEEILVFDPIPKIKLTLWIPSHYLKQCVPVVISAYQKKISVMFESYKFYW